MSTIDIRREHTQSLAAAKKHADAMAADLAEEFSLESAWQGNELHFSRSGVKGVMKVAKDHVHVTAKLGLLVALLKGQIEKRLLAHFDEVFPLPGSKAGAAKKAAAKTAGAKPVPAKTAAAKKTAAKTTAAKKAAAKKPSPRR
ncbi:MAG TPA: polyhydroxyalkanoic acid system family protein [Rubrivivax sp.]|nr:polyhydroxyalkanoic acid system family protein [Rubrivivax sp.]HPO19797.1 polyhydroxyalkanoic acid system family protein [Rubrivivax sp.]